VAGKPGTRGGGGGGGVSARAERQVGGNVTGVDDDNGGRVAPGR
jgi:hypothetical protein